jgi:radical SAM superfamily enzyme YgiQ (UPF0313 family)
MRICFIHASYYPKPGILAKGTKAWIHGLALPLLASCVDAEKHSITLVNDTVHPLPNGNSFDIFFISIMGSVFERTKEIISAVKTKNNYVVVGGKSLNETALLFEPYVDSIMLGEGESFISVVIDDIAKNQLKKYYGSRDFLSDISHLPIPRYDLIDRKRHSFIFPVEATRGCVNSCTYCYIASWSKCRYRTRPVEDVVRDITALKKMHVKHILFVDDNICADRQYALSLFKALKPLRIKWICQITASAIIDKELMTAAAESGLMAVTIGFESLSKKNLASVNKPNNPDLYAEGLTILHKLKIFSFPMFVIGFDDDIRLELKHIYDFCIAHQVTAPLMYLLTPVPGTVLHQEYSASGKITDTDLSRYNLFNVVFKPESLSAEDLEEIFWSTNKKLFSIKNIFKRVLLKKTPIINKIIQVGINIFLRKSIWNKMPLPIKR